MSTPDQPSLSPDTSPELVPSQTRVRFGLLLTLFGFFVFLGGTKPAIFGYNRSQVIGFIKISVFLIGLAIICVGGYISLLAYWENGARTIAAEIGSRLVATGYVVAIFSGMADVFGFGSQPPPTVPFFGPVQVLGVQIGEGLIVAGFLLLLPFRRTMPKAKK